jgi:hypothetical protein
MTARKKPNATKDPLEGECMEFHNRASLHISEYGVGATFLNPRREKLRKIKYDGCFNKDSGSRQADYIVGLTGLVDVITELKGSDISHAISQVEATLRTWRNGQDRFPRIVCLIVFGHTIPRMSSRIGTIERDFLLEHKTLLWIRETGSEKFNFRKLIGKSDAR